jgi:hypothetical protein
METVPGGTTRFVLAYRLYRDITLTAGRTPEVVGGLEGMSNRAGAAVGRSGGGEAAREPG